MLFDHIIDSCFEEKVGAAGIHQDQFNTLLDKTSTSIKNLKQKKENGELELLNLPYQTDDLEEIKHTAKTISENFETLIVLGTGGSTLNPQGILGLAPNNSNVIFIDHIDPFNMETLLNTANPKQTAFLAISKSGKTVETLAQTFICIQWLKQAGIANPGKQFFIISDPIESPLREIGKTIRATILDHNANVGGRFSSLTNVGLLPAAVAGLDIEAFREGAKAIIDQDLDINSSESAKGAALAMAMIEHNITTTVLMPYVERLSAFTTWYQQIWAESLGKDGKGSTPAKAIGTLDQHSQLQLYLGGPHDKLITLITLESQGQGSQIDSSLIEDASLNYLTNKTLGDINVASQQATADTLVKNGCPLRIIKLQTLNEKVLGGLFMHFMLETIITADLLGVNAFDQPAVEEGKILARKILA